MPRAAAGAAVIWPALLLGFHLGLARAQDEAPGAAAAASAPSDTENGMQDSLRQDPAVADSLAARIARSDIGGRISDASDPAQRVADIRRWIGENPDSAAHLALGLAQDDQEGGHRFESAVLRNMSRSFGVDAEHVGQSTYGRLRKSNSDSKLMGADAGMTEEERREILKSMFEGQGGMSNQIVTQKDAGKSPPGAPGGAGAAGLSANYYDRLSRLNLRGYSPQVLAIQNALNQRSAPGSPRLAETGKLDYATLSYPAFGMRYDLRNLELRLRYQENLELARRLHLDGRYRPEQLLDPAVGSALRQKAGAAGLDPRFARRRLALESAAEALRRFETAAAAAQAPNGLTRGALIALGARQKEAARWITVAALEEELQYLESAGGFLTPALRSLITACPAPTADRAAYLRRGEGLAGAWLGMKTAAQAWARALEADDWQSAARSVGPALAEGTRLRQDLSRGVRDFTLTPSLLNASCQPQPRWREALAAAMERYLPATRWGREERGRRARCDALKDVFGKIAAGDMAAAHAILAAAEPSAAGAR